MKITFKNALAVSLSAGLLSSCATSAAQFPPVVSSFNGDSVNIQVNSIAGTLPEPEKNLVKANMLAEANRICSKGSRKRAEYTSQRTISTGQYTAVNERLYLCLN